jgi:NAD(P)-dependent dehydrogenase (short-subunit alcohol dehydrogenase family)
MQNIIITGASGNLGSALLASLIGKPFRLHLVLRKPAQTPDTPQVVHHVADIASDEECKALVAHIEQNHGPVFGCIFLAGAYHMGNLADTTWEDVQRMFNANIGTVIPLYTTLAGYFTASGQGKLITIGAMASQPDGAQNHVAYALSKEVLRHLTHIAQKGFDSGPSAHILLPRALDTPINRAAMPDAPAHMFTRLEDIIEGIVSILEGRIQEQEIAY